MLHFVLFKTVGLIITYHCFLSVKKSKNKIATKFCGQTKKFVFNSAPQQGWQSVEAMFYARAAEAASLMFLITVHVFHISM